MNEAPKKEIWFNIKKSPNVNEVTRKGKNLDLYQNNLSNWIYKHNK